MLQGTHPIVVHLTLPVDDFSTDMQKAPAALDMIKKFVVKHDFSNFDAVILACNTAHLLANDLVKQTGIPLNLLILNTSEEVSKNGSSRVGIVSSLTTVKSNIFNFKGVELIVPNVTQLDQLKVMIKSVIAGEPHVQFLIDLNVILDSLFINGAEAVILGCTELELIMSGSSRADLIRPLDLTVESIFKQ